MPQVPVWRREPNNCVLEHQGTCETSGRAGTPKDVNAGSLLSTMTSGTVVWESGARDVEKVEDLANPTQPDPGVVHDIFL